MKMKLKNVFKKVSNVFNNTMDFITLKEEIKILERELEESKKKEKPYIDKIQSLKSDNRVLKILNTKLEKKNAKLVEDIQEMKEKTNYFFDKEI